MNEYKLKNACLIGWYYPRIYLDSCEPVDLKYLLDKFESIFELIAFTEEETATCKEGSEESLWMGRIAGFFCNFVRV